MRDFFATKLSNCECVNGTYVLHFLIESNQIHVKLDDSGKYDKSDFSYSRGAVQRYPKYKGFKRGHKKGTVHVNPEQIARRNEYIRNLLENRSNPHNYRILEVYTD